MREIINDFEKPQIVLFGGRRRILKDFSEPIGNQDFQARTLVFDGSIIETCKTLFCVPKNQRFFEE